jgi:hypothetical protein
MMKSLRAKLAARLVALLMVAAFSLLLHPTEAICAAVAEAPEDMSLWWCPGPVGDDNPCTIDVCLPFFGDFYVPRRAGASCGGGDACGASAACDGHGACVAGPSVPVDDDNPCTVDSCDAELGARHEPLPDGTACGSDSNACTVDSCVQGACEHAAIACDDGNACTTDACDFTLGCVATPNVGQACDDGDACTVDDACDASGACASGAPLHCDDGVFCNGAETCDSAAGCVAGSAPAIDDGVACTADACDEAAHAVVHLPQDAACDDGDACTGVDRCDAALGCVAGAPFICTLHFASQPVTSIEVGSWSLPPEAVDLRLFTAANGPAPVQWAIAADGIDATVQNEADYSFLVSDFEAVTERLEADVQTIVSNGDDDFFGVAWGYQDNMHTYLMYWKGGTQDWGHFDLSPTVRGLSVRMIDNPNHATAAFTYHGNYQTSKELYYADIGAWTNVTAYRMTVDVDPGLFTTRVVRVSSGAVLNETTIQDGKYLKGHFALYDYQQRGVRFSNVRRTVRAHADYVYEPALANVETGEHATFSLVAGPPGMTVDPETGRVSWQMSVRSAGVHTVTLHAEDGAGHADDQTFELEVVDGGPCYEAPATLPSCPAP